MTHIITKFDHSTKTLAHFPKPYQKINNPGWKNNNDKRKKHSDGARIFFDLLSKNTSPDLDYFDLFSTADQSVQQSDKNV